VVLLLAACIDSSPVGDDGRQELTLLLFGGPEEVAGYERMATAMEAANDDLALTISPVANQDELLARLSTSFAGVTRGRAGPRPIPPGQVPRSASPIRTTSTPAVSIRWPASGPARRHRPLSWGPTPAACRCRPEQW